MPELAPIRGDIVILRAFADADADAEMVCDLATDPCLPLIGTIPP